MRSPASVTAPMNSKWRPGSSPSSRSTPTTSRGRLGMDDPSPASPGTGPGSAPSPAKGERDDAAVSPAPLPPKDGRGVGERGARKKLLRSRAKGMRREPTPAEHRLWQILRAKRLAGHKFKRQLVLDDYIADFACLQQRLIIEADGGQHCESDRDSVRDAYLQSQGFRILRFWNNEILENEEGVFLAILSALEDPSAQPLSRRGERGLRSDHA
ncbi:MAG TPA: endonuclease domain-containing protein [Sphingomicrobium sp.]|nr:endonuclease domain-containing protein [Sphingomicrobium sp.]